MAAHPYLIFSAGKHKVFTRNPSVHNTGIPDLILFSLFACQMDLILNFPIQSYLCCFFHRIIESCVSARYIIFMQGDWFISICLQPSICHWEKQANAYPWYVCIFLFSEMLFSANWLFITAGNVFPEFILSIFNSVFFWAPWHSLGNFQSQR